MVTWYKEKTVVFKLKDTAVKEDFAIWKGWKFRNDTVNDYAPDGGETKYPLKEGGSIKGTDGKVYMVEDAKFLKKGDFIQLFPKLAKNTKYIRVILIGGLEYNYRFGTTANKAINDFIALSEGVVPVKYLKQTYFPNAAPAQMYQISIVSDIEAKEWETNNLQDTVEKTGTSKPAVEIQKEKLAIEMPSLGTEMSQFEIAFVDQLKAMPTKFDQDKFVKAFVATAATQGKIAEYTNKGQNIEARGQWLYTEKYSK